MDDRELYATILGVTSPWTVDRVVLQEASEVVEVYVVPTPGTTWRCPRCDAAAPGYDHTERRWRHLDTCQFRTVLCARVPRVRCPIHGVTTVRVPWAEANSRFTLLFERLAIAWLREATPKAVARRLGLSWDEARGIQERAVRRGLARRSKEPVVRRLGIDEKSFLRRHQYVSVLVDLDRGRVIDVMKDRKAESLAPYFATRAPAELAALEAIVMDMWEPYRKTVRAWVPDADQKIVFDKFHIMMHVNNALDTVRKQEHRVLQAEGDSRLTRTKYQWLRSAASFTPEAWRQFAALRNSTLKSARAWAMKESLAALWVYQYPASARKFFSWWFNWATRSRLAPMAKVARMLRAHLENILTYLKYRVTNAVTEGLNAKIQWIKYGGRGYRNAEAFRMAILFHCGGLDLDPRAS
jgi:transposase